jgi:hypothetical protein
MKKVMAAAALVGFAVAFVAGCTTTKTTNRRTVRTITVTTNDTTVVTSREL